MRDFPLRATRALCLILAALAVGAVALYLSTCAPSPHPPALQSHPPAARELSSSIAAPSIPPLVAVAPPERPSYPLTGACDDPETPGGGEWGREDRARTRRQVDAIAREMGLDGPTRRLLVRWASRESHATPHAVHVMPGDRRAATSRRARAAVEALGQDFTEAWGYGRGLYGMQPAYYVGRWDPAAHPDVLCDPIVATVVAIWAARDHAAECDRQGYPRSLLVANRRWGSGHCAPRESDASARAWWAARGRDVDATPARWGRRWPQSGDRAEVYDRVREIAHAVD